MSGRRRTDDRWREVFNARFIRHSMTQLLNFHVLSMIFRCRSKNTKNQIQIGKGEKKKRKKRIREKGKMKSRLLPRFLILSSAGEKARELINIGFPTQGASWTRLSFLTLFRIQSQIWITAPVFIPIPIWVMALVLTAILVWTPFCIPFPMWIKKRPPLFLDASSHLYNRVCPPIRLSVCSSVRH